MKALYNPKTGMVCSWSELKASMGHLQEVEVKDKSEINQPLKRLIPEAPEAQPGGFPVAGEDEKAYVAPKKASKKKVSKKKAAVKEHKADTSTEDDFNVDNL